MSGNERILERLRPLSSGERAALRRCAGQPLSAADARALQALFRAMPADVAPPGTGQVVRGALHRLPVGCRGSPCKGGHAAHAARLRAGCGVRGHGPAACAPCWTPAGTRAAISLASSRASRACCAPATAGHAGHGRPARRFEEMEPDSRGVQLRWANEYYLSEKEEKPDAD